MSAQKLKPGWRNWAGSVQAQPNHYSYPGSFEEIQSEVLRAAEEGQRLRVAGSGRAFSPLCWTDENLMSLKNFHGIERWNEDRSRVWVRSGTRMGELGELLAASHCALEHWQGPAVQTLGGVINTGAHSSGRAFGSLSAQVSGVHLVCADGSARTINAQTHAHLFDAARLSLGALGVITHVELHCVPAYRLRRRSARARLEDVLPHLSEHLARNRAFNFRWYPHTNVVQLQSYNLTDDAVGVQRPLDLARQAALRNTGRWLMTQAARRMPGAASRLRRLGATPPEVIETILPAHLVMPGGQRLPHHQIEYALPLENLGAALAQMQPVLRASQYAIQMPLELSFAARDDLWLSTAYGRDTAYIALRVPDAAAYQEYFSAMSQIADQHGARAAWSGMHGKTAPELAKLYPRFEDFCQVRRALDPRGVFLNPHLSDLLGVQQL